MVNLQYVRNRKHGGGKLAGILTDGDTDAEEIPVTWTDDEVGV